VGIPVTVLAGRDLAARFPFTRLEAAETLGVYCLIVILCVSIKGFLSFMRVGN